MARKKTLMKPAELFDNQCLHAGTLARSCSGTRFMTAC